MSPLAHRVHHIHDGIMSMCLRELSDEVHTYNIPAIVWYGKGMELSGWTTTLNLCPETKVACPCVLTNIPRHLWPLVVLGNEFQSLPASRMPRNLGVMVLQCDAMAELWIIGHIDAVSETEQSITF